MFCPAYQEYKAILRLGDRLLETKRNIEHLKVVCLRAQAALAHQAKTKLLLEESLKATPVGIFSVPSMNDLMHYIKTGKEKGGV